MESDFLNWRILPVCRLETELELLFSFIKSGSKMSLLLIYDPVALLALGFADRQLVWYIRLRPCIRLESLSISVVKFVLSVSCPAASYSKKIDFSNR